MTTQPIPLMPPIPLHDVGALRQCPQCGRLYTTVMPHACPLVWECSITGADDDWQPAYGDDAEDAAISFAISADCLPGTVYVRPAFIGADAKRYSVRMDMRPHFTATEVKGGA